MSQSHNQVSAPAMPQAVNPWRKLLIEMGPLLVFFLANWKFGIYAATGAFMAAMAASMVYSWIAQKHIPPMLWVTGTVVAVFGGLTLVLHNDMFIKLKPTIVNTLFAAVLFAGLFLNRPFLKLLFEAAFPPITEAGWRRLTVNWACFFLFLAALNEVVWRNFSTDFWVAFKVWGVMPITFLFMMTQVPVMMKNLIKDEQSPAE